MNTNILVNYVCVLSGLFVTGDKIRCTLLVKKRSRPSKFSWKGAVMITLSVLLVMYCVSISFFHVLIDFYTSNWFVDQKYSYPKIIVVNWFNNSFRVLWWRKKNNKHTTSAMHLLHAVMFIATYSWLLSCSYIRNDYLRERNSS